MTDFNPMVALGMISDGVQNFGRNVTNAVEDTVCDAWKSVIPGQLQQFLLASQQQPWRAIQRGMSLTAAQAVPFSVMPFTLPLVIFFFPLVITFETARVAFALFANCGRASQTIANEAADILFVLDNFAPGTPQGILARTILNAAGAGVVVTAYDAIQGPARTLLVPLSQNRNVQPSDVAALALAVGRVVGDEDLLAFMSQSATQIDQLEAFVTARLAEVDALASTVSVSSSSVEPMVGQFTQPAVAAAAAAAIKKNQPAVDGAAVAGAAASALGIYAAIRAFGR